MVKKHETIFDIGDTAYCTPYGSPVEIIAIQIYSKKREVFYKAQHNDIWYREAALFKTKELAEIYGARNGTNT